MWLQFHPHSLGYIPLFSAITRQLRDHMLESATVAKLGCVWKRWGLGPGLDV